MVTKQLSIVGLMGGALAFGCAEQGSPVAPAAAFQAVGTAAPAPFLTSVANPCNGELVDIEGWIQLRFVTRSDAQAGSHTVGQILEHGQGIGEVTGGNYVFSVDSLIDVNARAIQSAGSQEVVVRLIGQGQAPSFLGTQILHFTVNANGDPVGVVDDFRSECR